MRLIGLTGGIGSGKSTVSAEFAGRGALVIDADAIVHELQRSGTAVFNEMVERFGPSIVGENGELDRAEVASLVFSDTRALADLGAIVHPRVHDEIMDRLAAARDSDRLVILDVPLLVESGWSDLDATIVVDLDPEIAIERLVEHRGYSKADARSRIERQASRADRLDAADFVIDNSGDLQALAQQIEKAWRWIEEFSVSELPG